MDHTSAFHSILIGNDHKRVTAAIVHLSICFSTDHTYRQTSLKQPAISQTADIGHDRSGIMFYLGCERDSGVSLAAVGVRANKSIAWPLPYTGALQLRMVGGLEMQLGTWNQDSSLLV